MNAFVAIALLSSLFVLGIQAQEDSEPRVHGYRETDFGSLDPPREKRSLQDDVNELLEGLREDIRKAANSTDARMRNFVDKVGSGIAETLQKQINKAPESVKGKILEAVKIIVTQIRDQLAKGPQ